jgi:hypothetical protein
MFRTCVLATTLVLAASTAVAQPSIGKPFDLKVGESVTVGTHGLTVGFDELVSDGRCPIGLLCFWEGDAATLLWSQRPGETRQDFQLHTYSGFKQKVSYGDYVITLVQVSPYPVYQAPTAPGDYVATIRVDGGPSPVEASTWGGIKALYHL